jgi:hypothetical protein
MPARAYIIESVQGSCLIPRTTQPLWLGRKLTKADHDHKGEVHFWHPELKAGLSISTNSLPQRRHFLGTNWQICLPLLSSQQAGWRNPYENQYGKRVRGANITIPPPAFDYQKIISKVTTPCLPYLRPVHVYSSTLLSSAQLTIYGHAQHRGMRRLSFEI